MRQQLTLSEVSKALGLSDEDVRQLREIGINGVADFLGLLYAAFDDVAQELNIPRSSLQRIGQELRKYIDPYLLQQIEDAYNSMPSPPTGAELGPPPRPGKDISDYKEE